MLQIQKTSRFLKICERTLIPRASMWNFREASKETLYDVLGVKQDASESEIKSAYLKLCKQYHPDAKPNDKKAKDKFVKISQAYDILSKPSEKKLYDDSLKAGLSPEPGEVYTTQNWNPKHAQYYYHPKFYKDPKMREQAAKAWEQNTGWSYGTFYENNKISEERIQELKEARRRGMKIFAGIFFAGWCLAFYQYYSTKNYLERHRQQGAAKLRETEARQGVEFYSDMMMRKETENLKYLAKDR